MSFLRGSTYEHESLRQMLSKELRSNISFLLTVNSSERDRGG